jgi:hypothetical protein
MTKHVHMKRPNSSVVRRMNGAEGHLVKTTDKGHGDTSKIGAKIPLGMPIAIPPRTTRRTTICTWHDEPCAMERQVISVVREGMTEGMEIVRRDEKKKKVGERRNDTTAPRATFLRKQRM